MELMGWEGGREERGMREEKHNDLDIEAQAEEDERSGICEIFLTSVAALAPAQDESESV